MPGIYAALRAMLTRAYDELSNICSNKEVDMQASQPEPLALSEPLTLILPFAPEAVACGFPSPAEGYWAGDLDLIEHMVRDPACTFIWRAAGHSMTGAGIDDGDLLLVDRGIDPVPGKLVIAVVDGEYTVKRLDIVQGRTVLLAENLDYPDVVLHEHSDMTVWGVVIWILKQPATRRGVRPRR